MSNVKYFIHYKDFIDNNTINKKIDSHSNELKIVKKYKDGSIRVTPISCFKNYAQQFIEYADNFCNNKKGIFLMVELTKEETTSFNPLQIKKYITNDNTHFEIITNEIKLINYTSFVNMSLKEMNSGNIHKTITLVSKGKNTFEIDINDKNINQTNSMLEKRMNLAENGIGSDIYFYTDDEDVLEKYKDDITILKEVDNGLFKIVSQKLFIIDSIPQTTVSDMGNETFRLLFEICNKSIPINISQNDDESYDLNLNKIRTFEKKGYMFLGTNLNTILYNQAILPLLKYINIYQLENDKYKIMNIEEYMKKNNILKYIKKPSKN